MKPTLFYPETDFAPIPFHLRHCQVAAELKQAGLPWTPHVGCFVWDRDGHTTAGSPFPHRIYFILDPRRFLQIFPSVDEMTEKLIWLPTEHQARLLCVQFKVSQKAIASGEAPPATPAPDDILLALCHKLLIRCMPVRPVRKRCSTDC